jgi:3-deoxy-manno-octulosonate cytidylyltransferase (CMP-KDO synthetase)
MTSSGHETGTDRVAEVARALEADYIVNLQGDEPVFEPGLVERMVEALDVAPEAEIATACHPITSADEYGNPNVVKVVCDAGGRALYFSRAPIPHGWKAGAAGGQPARRHVGIYAYRREALLRFAALPRTPLERSERLEQLRALEHGMRIVVVETQRPTVGVDVPDDVKAVEKVILELYTGLNRPSSEGRRP